MKARNKPSDERHTIGEQRSRIEQFRSVFRKADRALEAKENKIVRHFKYGVRIVCAMTIWESLKTAAGASTQEQLAMRFHIDKSIVSRGFNEGALSLENLIVMLTEMRLEFCALSDMPSLEERALGGYAEATRYLRSLESGTPPELGISRPAFFCLKSLYEEPDWFEAEAQLAEDDDVRSRLNDLTEKVRRRAERASGMRVSYVTPEDFRRLNREWGEAFWSCFVTVAYHWIGGDHA